MPQGVPGQGRPCEICLVPSSYHLELQSCGSYGRKLKVCTATMQPNARQVLLPGVRSLIERCLACELHLKVLWHGEPRELAESTLSVARFTILCCKMMPHLDRVLPDPIVRLNSCHLILQFQVTLWLTSGVQGMLSSWNLLWPVSTTFPVLKIKPSDGWW